MKIILFLLILLCMIGNASAATYYVTHDASGGGDGSWGSPWTLVEGFSSASASDTVKIQGGTYTNMHPVVGNSGSSGNLIIFESDNGTVILDGVDDTGYGVTSSKDYIHIKNLEIINFYDGISFDYSDYFNISGCTITSCGRNGVWIEGGGSDSVITECTINSNVETGIVLFTAFVSTFDIKNNYIDDYDATYYDYAFAMASGVTVHHDVLEYDRYYFESGTDTIVFTGAIDFNVSASSETVFSYETYGNVIVDIEVYSGTITSTDVGVDTDDVNYMLKCDGGTIESQTSDGSGDITFTTDLNVGNNIFGFSNFTSTWNTSKTCAGSSNSDQIKLPLESDGTYDFIVYWGDGSDDTVTVWNQANVTHTYAVEGEYNVSIVGTLYGFRFNNWGDRFKILDISNWGNMRIGNNSDYFYGCYNINVTATDPLDLTDTTSLNDMFHLAYNFFNGKIGNWDVSQVTDMSGMFYYATLFNQDIGDWDTSSVTDTSMMFQNDKAFNQDISGWDVSSVTDMHAMFYHDIGTPGVAAFNQDIGGWDVSKVTNMQFMFRDTIFNQDIGSWDVSNVTDMDYMFYKVEDFDQDIGSWNVSSVTTMSDMFYNAGLSTTNYDLLLNGWSALPSLQNSVVFHAGSSKYSQGVPASARNDTLIGVYSWSITDGGVIFDVIEISNPNPPGDFEMIVDELQLLTLTLSENATSVWFVDEVEIQTDHNTTTPDYYFTSTIPGVYNVTCVSTDPIYGSSDSFTWFITVIDEDAEIPSVPAPRPRYKYEEVAEYAPEVWDDAEAGGLGAAIEDVEEVIEDVEEVLSEDISDQNMIWIILFCALLLAYAYYRND